MVRRNSRAALALCLAQACLWLWSGPATAQTTAPSVVWTPAASNPNPDQVGFFTGIWQRGNLLGDMGGLRPWLGKYGVTFSLSEVSEGLGNVAGGVHQGFTYDGLTTATLALDTGAAFGWDGGTFNVSALQIHGRNLSSSNLSSLQTASGIEADRGTRLWELWYQQAMLDGQADVKLGQQSLDQEFIVSSNALLFVNTMFGWPMVPSADLPSGGPAYPLSSPGARLRVKPNDQVTALLGVFDDNPAGPGTSDPQIRNASGTNFRSSDSPLVIGEVQYALNQPAQGAMDYGKSALGLPGTYKLGFWYDAGNFSDQEIDTSGLSLANPASNGMALQHRGDYSFYGVVDQAVWQDPDSAQALGFFTRAMGTPLADRNSITFSLNIGLTLKDPLPGRDNDTAGIGFNYAQVSGRASAFDRDTAAFNPGTFSPVRSNEEVIEATYQYQIVPWWQLQPDFQYVFNPGGGIKNPNNPTLLVGNEAVIGVRTTVTF
jgi:porin